MGTNHAERKNPPPCPHEREHGEGTVWPDDVSLEHFDRCLTLEGRLFVWKGVRRMADQGSRCIMADHDTAVRRVQACLDEIATLRQVARTDQAYIISVVSQLRQVVADLEQPGGVPLTSPGAAVGPIRDTLRGILETRTESVEQVDP